MDTSTLVYKLRNTDVFIYLMNNRFNRFIGRSHSLMPSQQEHVKSASLIPTNSKLKKSHTYSASNI